MVGPQEEPLRFDYAQQDRPALRIMTEDLLTTTREKVDKFSAANEWFGLLQPESDPVAVLGLI